MSIHHIFNFITRSILVVAVLCNLYSCKKYIEEAPPTIQLQNAQVYSNDANAAASAAGMYRSLHDYCTGSVYTMTIVTGLSGDELLNYFPNAIYDEFSSNHLLATNTQLPWSKFYRVIYIANDILQGVENNPAISTPVKNQLVGEAKFMRAYSYFNLVNLFGEVPLVTATDVIKNNTAPRSAVTVIYDQVTNDLVAAIPLLPVDFTSNGGQRTRATQWAAKALLARVNLFRGDWAGAEKNAAEVVSTGLFRLVNDLDSFSVKNSMESILQMNNNATGDGNSEAGTFIFTTSPVIVCTPSLVAAFEPNDLRKIKWMKTGIYAGQTLTYPYKYKTTATGSNENYILLRLAEQYLVLAEARARQNNLAGALTALNQVRKRSNLPDVANVLTQTQLLDTLLHERRVELFAETGHRWFDLRRAGKLNAVMQAQKPGLWQPDAQLYPLPLADLQNDVRLTQNPGY